MRSTPARSARATPWSAAAVADVPVPSDRVRRVVVEEFSGLGLGVAEEAECAAAPFILPRFRYREVFRAARALLGLLRRTALELAPTPRERVAALGATESDYPLFSADTAAEERYAACMARPDVVLGRGGPRFLEFNVSGGFGGVVASHAWYRVWRRLHGDRTFGFEDPFAARADLFAAVCDELALPRRLAWVGTSRDLQQPDSARYFQVELDHLAGRGFTARHFEPEELAASWDAPAGERYPLGLRHLTTSEWAETGIDIGPVREAIGRGSLLLAPQHAELLANKLLLGAVSEGRPWMTASERRVVARYLPWTRVLAPGRTDRAGDPVDLVEHALGDRRGLVLKRGIGLKGEQVVVGRSSTAGEWETAVRRAADLGDSIVQEYVPTVPCSLALLGAGERRPHTAEVRPVLSPFLFGGRPGGMWARFLRAPGDVVGVRRYRALQNVVVAV